MNTRLNAVYTLLVLADLGPYLLLSLLFYFSWHLNEAIIAAILSRLPLMLLLCLLLYIAGTALSFPNLIRRTGVRLWVALGFIQIVVCGGIILTLTTL